MGIDLLRTRNTRNNSKLTMSKFYDCSFCLAIDSIINFHGEYTCKSCGTVFNCELQDQCVHYSDETFDHTNRGNSQLKRKFDKLNRMCEQYDRKRRVQDSINPLCDLLEHNMLLDQTFVDMTREWFKLVVSTDPSVSKKRLQFVCCCYCVSAYLKRGLELKVFCNYFEVELCQAWSYLPIITDSFKHQRWYSALIRTLDSHCEKIKRTVYQLSCVEPRRQPDIIKRACDLFLKIKDYSKISACKPINVRHTCVYIACNLVCVKIKKKEFCEELCLSAPTLSSIETFIQEALLSINVN